MKDMHIAYARSILQLFSTKEYKEPTILQGIVNLICLVKQLQLTNSTDEY